MAKIQARSENDGKKYRNNNQLQQQQEEAKEIKQQKKPHPRNDKINFNGMFKQFTGYDTENFKSLDNFTKWLHRPADGSALGVFRLLFGAAMLIDIAEERGGGQLDLRFGEPLHCHFPLINGMRAASFHVMGLIYLTMWLGAIGIMLGFRFRISCCAFVVPYWYIFLLDKPAWNNHSYLFGLCGILLLFTQANYCCSLDKYLNPQLPSVVPYWNYFLIKFQFFVLYMYAGLKKFSSEWLSGYAMESLGRHWVFAPLRLLMSVELIDLLVVHWLTAIFDSSIAFFMTWERTRLLATPFMLMFHLLNSRLFVIGMFPWVCLAEVPLFFGFDLARKGLAFLKKGFSYLYYNTEAICSNNKSLKETSTKQTRNIGIRPTHKNNQCLKSKTNTSKKSCTTNGLIVQSSENGPTLNARSKLHSILVLTYCALQIFLPYSHFITKGYNNWTSGLYGYSWDMMVHTYDTILTSIKIVDNFNGNVHYLEPYAFTEYDRWTKYADMALQYAKCIESNVLTDFTKDPTVSPLTSANFSIYFDIWCSMNGRFQQRVFDPRVDLLKASWTPFESTSWSLPLLRELNYMRPKLKAIADDVLAWNNYSDVIFIADFPGLTLENFISADLTNVSLTILEGNVRLTSNEQDANTYFLTAGMSFTPNSGVMHSVTTIGPNPSCYFYTYVNKTMLEIEESIDDNKLQEHKPMLPLWKEFQIRVANYKKFLIHLVNCVLYTLYDVPIPIEMRKRD